MPCATPELQKEYQRKWIAKRRFNFFKDKICIKCGSNRDLNLDHIDPTQKVTHKIWSWSEARRVIELTKCQVLCRNCHVIKTNKDNNYELVHGTATGYTSYLCRCSLCTRAKVNEVNEWRWKTGRRVKRLFVPTMPL